VPSDRYRSAAVLPSAAAVRPQQGHDLTRADGERDTVDRDDAAVRLDGVA